MGRLSAVTAMDVPEEHARLAVRFLRGDITNKMLASELRLSNPSNVAAWLLPRLRDAYWRGWIEIRLPEDEVSNLPAVVRREGVSGVGSGRGLGDDLSGVRGDTSEEQD